MKTSLSIILVFLSITIPTSSWLSRLIDPSPPEEITDIITDPSIENERVEDCRTKQKLEFLRHMIEGPFYISYQPKENVRLLEYSSQVGFPKSFDFHNVDDFKQDVIELQSLQVEDTLIVQFSSYIYHCGPRDVGEIEFRGDSLMINVVFGKIDANCQAWRNYIFKISNPSKAEYELSVDKTVYPFDRHDFDIVDYVKRNQQMIEYLSQEEIVYLIEMLKQLEEEHPIIQKTTRYHSLAEKLYLFQDKDFSIPK